MKNFLLKKELTLVVLTLAIGGIFAALEMKTSDNLFVVFIIPLIAGLAEYVAVIKVLGKGRVYATYAWTMAICCMVLAIILSVCAAFKNVADMANALCLISMLSGVLAFFASLYSFMERYK